jgi:signal transduction histidine kinase
MLDRLDEAEAAQRAFMASIGHELRTPITVARGHLELLEAMDGNDPDAVAETVTILRDELTRMGRLVEDLMAIARADMDDFVRPRDLELVQWFEELELRLSGLEAGSATRIDPPPPVLLHADPDRLAQAVLNLVTNAHLHTPAGTRIRVNARLAEAHVVIAVEDDGPGIPEAIREEVFAPFIRAGETPSSTGLGLAVVKAVVTAHGGDVTMDTDSSGTRVQLRLPWTPTAPDDVAADDDPADTLELAIADPAEASPTLRLHRPR